MPTFPSTGEMAEWQIVEAVVLKCTAFSQFEFRKQTHKMVSVTVHPKMAGLRVFCYLNIFFIFILFL